MKSNVIRKLLPVMLTITLTAGIAPVSYAAAEEPVQQTEGVDEEPVQDFENEDADDQIPDESVKIDKFYPGFYKWAKSKGEENKDWDEYPASK